MTPCFSVELLVRLTIPDSTVMTTRQTLHRLGMTTVARVYRAERWRFTIQGEHHTWQDVANRLQHVDVLVNANKHRSTVDLLSSPHDRPLPALTPLPAAGTFPAWISVRSRYDTRAESVTAALRTRLGFDRLVGCERDDVWRLDVAAASPDEAESVAAAAAHRLLANPQFQEATVFRG